MRASSHDYVWPIIPSCETPGQVRMPSIALLLAEIGGGKNAGRYVAWGCPSLLVERGAFDIGLSSHSLFPHNTHLSVASHLQALWERRRVAHEVQVFPLLILDGFPSRHMPIVTEPFSHQAHRVDVRHVHYEFQRDGNEMLAITHA